MVDETSWLFQNLAVKGLVMCGLSCSVGVDRFVQTSVGVSFVRSLVVHHWSSVRHQRNIPALTIFGSLQLSANMVFLIPEVGKTPLYLWKFGCPMPCRVIASLYWSWSICTIVYGIELQNKLFCISLIQCWSPKEYSGLACMFIGSLPLCLWKFCFPRPRPCHVWIALLYWSWWI